MDNSNDKISSSTLMFAIACSYLGKSLLLGFVTSVTRNETWFVVITGFMVDLLIIWLYVSLSLRFPGKDLIQINEIVFGKVLGKIFSALYIFYFFILTCLNTENLGRFVVGNIMPETPKIVILILFILVCCYAVRKGAQVITKYSMVLVILFLATMLFNTALMISRMKLSNFQPTFSLPIMNYVQGTHTVGTISSCGTIYFFMLFPNLKNSKNIKKPFLTGTIIGMATMLFISMRNIAILGPAIEFVSNTSYEVFRLINIGSVLTRMELFSTLILIIFQFFEISLSIYATAKAIERLFNLQSYKIVVNVIGALVISCALAGFESSMEHTFWGINMSATFSTFFGIVLPLITLIAALIRGFRKQKEGTVS